MFGLGVQELILIAVIIFFVSVVRRSGSSRIAGPTLVLRKFSINESYAITGLNQ